MNRWPLYQVDAFAGRLFAGNPAAVVVMSAFPDDTTLRDIAAENNLPETAFIVPIDGHYHLRWFTPTVEVPLCGHATLASSAVVMERLEPGRSIVEFHTASGTLTVRRQDGGYVMDFPARPAVPVAAPPVLRAILGDLLLETLDDGFNYIAVLNEARSVRAFTPDLDAIMRLDRDGLVLTAPGDTPHDFVSRYFAPAKGIPEDPVTGGAHCALAPYWAKRLDKTLMRAFQASSRGGEIVCRLSGNRVHLEGSCVFFLEGHISV